MGRTEARRLATSPPFILLFVLLPWVMWPIGSVFDLRRAAPEAHIRSLLFALVTLVFVNRAMLRGRRDGTEELLSTLPAPAIARTGGVLISLFMPFLLGWLIVGGLILWTVAFRSAYGVPAISDLAVTPLNLVLIGAAGVLVARLIRWSLPGSVLVAVPFLMFWTNAPTIGALADLRGLVQGTWIVDGPLDLLVPVSPVLHAVYLVCLIVLVACLALITHKPRRAGFIATAGLTLVAVAGTGWWQVRYVPSDWEAKNRELLVEPANHQVCEVHGGATYCAYPAMRALIGHWRIPVEGVLALVPAGSRPSGLNLDQRLSIGDLQYLHDNILPILHSRLPGLPTQQAGFGPRALLEPGMGEWSDLYLALGVASESVGLPTGPTASYSLCDVGGQSRAAIALWLAGSASRDLPDRPSWFPDGAAQLKEQVDSRSVNLAGREGGPFIIFDDSLFGTPASGAAWGHRELTQALRMLERPADQVKTTLASDWERLTHPATPTAALESALGLPSVSPAKPTWKPEPNWDPISPADAVTVTGACL